MGRGRASQEGAQSWQCGRAGAGGGRCQSLAGAGGRGRGVPRPKEEVVQGAGRGWDAGTRRVRAPGRLWEVRDPSSSLSLAFLPPLSPPSPPPPPPPSALPRRGLPALARRDGTRDGEAPRGRRGCAGGGCPAAGWRAPGRGRGRQAEAADPQPPDSALEMTGCERTSDVRGQPAPGRRFQGTASNPPPAPGPRKPPSLRAPAFALR
ncbi:formin-like protein 5 [Zalophus californianus]|uniref:Formin-like protein 5 n=1 Tax=Zalophus californianus TaxID=9704 RepID=A0A6J2DJL0_ZALCA|nr:formin-like protein 5 [Zalophus californianus]